MVTVTEPDIRCPNTRKGLPRQVLVPAAGESAACTQPLPSLHTGVGHDLSHNIASFLESCAHSHLPGSSCVAHTKVCTEKTFQGCHQGLKREGKAVLILPCNLVPLASDPGVPTAL